MLASASPLAAGSSSGGSSGFLLILIIAAVMFLLMSRNSRAQKRRAQQMRSDIVPGAEVLTSAGLHATVVDIEDDTVRLEIAPGVVARFDKRAVVRVLTPEVPALPEPIAEQDSVGENPAGDEHSGDDHAGSTVRD